MYNKFLPLLFSLVSISFGQIITNGPCKNVTAAVHNFKLPEFLGNWYEIKCYPLFRATRLECLQTLFSVWNNSITAVNATGKNPLTNLTESFHGHAFEEYPTEDVGCIKLKMHGLPIDETFYILAAQKDSFILSWACHNIPEPDMNSQFMWVHARQPKLTLEENTIIEEVINKLGLNSTRLVDTIQDPEICGM